MQVWLITAGERLYDPDMRSIASASSLVAEAIARSLPQPLSLSIRPMVTTREALLAGLERADSDGSCLATIVWHMTPRTQPRLATDLPDGGKPVCFLHDNRGAIQAVPTRRVTVVVGNARESSVGTAIQSWARAAVGFLDFTASPVLAVEAGEPSVTESDIERTIAEYAERYEIPFARDETRFAMLRDPARTEITIRRRLDQAGAGAFTTGPGAGDRFVTGLVTQRLMEKGFGFAPEHWTARLVRSLKVMGLGEGGTSYADSSSFRTDHGGMDQFSPHMLDLCPTLGSAESKPVLSIPSVGGRLAPPRLSVTMPPTASWIAAFALPGRRAVIANRAVAWIDADPSAPLEIQPKPGWDTARACWSHAGSPVHSAITTNVELPVLETWCRLCGLDFLAVEDHTTLRSFARSWSG